MTTSKIEMEQQLGALISGFLQSQLGESATSVITLLAGNTVAVRTYDCLTPVEKTLAQNENDWRLLQHFKTQQFEHMQPLLKRKLEEVTGAEVLHIVTTVGKDGLRFEVVTFSEDLESKLH